MVTDIRSGALGNAPSAMGNALLMILYDLLSLKILWAGDQTFMKSRIYETFIALLTVACLYVLVVWVVVLPLTVLDIEHYDLDIKSNSRSHHTQLCGEERLIVRRGQPFNIILHLTAGSKDFKPGEPGLTLIVETGTTDY